MGDSYDFMVRRDDLRRSRVDAGAAGEGTDPGPDGCLLRVDNFSITANNVTYGAMGDALRYWEFFPSERPGWGRVPAWGYAEVVASGVDGVPVGSRLFGFLPMSTHLVVRPTAVDGTGFVDGSAHRADLPAIYNRYGFVTPERGETPEREPFVALFAPLFMTSYLLADWLREEGFFGAGRALLSSASSKTALALAHELRRIEGAPAVVGLTSQGNLPFVTGTGLYDDVLPYEALPEMAADPATAYVDFGGNADLRARIHAHLGERLVASVVVGAADWERLAPSGEAALPGPRPRFFFAPDRIAKRNRDWGAAELRGRTSRAQAEFVESSRSWLTIRRDAGPEAIRAVFTAFLDGRVDPAEGWSIRP